MTCVFTIVTILLTAVSGPDQGNDFRRTEGDSVILRSAMKLISENEYDSAWKLLHNIRHPLAIAEAFHWLAFLHASKSNQDSAIFYYHKSREAWQNIGRADGIASAELNLSIAYKNRGQYDQALFHGQNAITYLATQPPSRELASAYNNTAIIFSNTKDFDKALAYHRQTLQVRKQLHLPSQVAQSLNNLGNTFLAVDRLDSALTCFVKALNIKRQLNDDLASTLNNIGAVQIRLGNYPEARTYLEESLAIKEVNNNQLGKVITLKFLGELELLSGNLKKSEVHLNNGEALAREIRSLQWLRDILLLQSQRFETKGEFKRALTYHKEVLSVKDSLLNIEKASVISELQTRFETEKKEQQILLMQQESELQAANLRQQNILIFLLVLGIALVATILVLLWINARNVQKSKARVEMLMHELQHRVRNNLQLLSGIFTLQTKNLTDASSIALARGSEGRVNAIAMIHRELSIDGQQNQVAMDHYIRELLNALINAYRQDNTELHMQLQLDHLKLDVDKAMPLGLIINELVTNSFKYAFPGIPNPRLAVTLKMESDQSLLLQVSDNGHQVKDVSYYESTKSFGLHMVRTLVRELHGKLEIHLQNGTHFYLHIPVAA